MRAVIEGEKERIGKRRKRRRKYRKGRRELKKGWIYAYMKRENED